MIYTEVSSPRAYRSAHWSRNTGQFPCLETPWRKSWRYRRRIHKYGPDYRGFYRPRSRNGPHLWSGHGDRRRARWCRDICLGRKSTQENPFYLHFYAYFSHPGYRSRLFLSMIRWWENPRNNEILDRKSRHHHDSHESPLYRPGESYQRAKKLAKLAPCSIIPLLGALVERSYRSLQSSGSRFDSGRCLQYCILSKKYLPSRSVKPYLKGFFLAYFEFESRCID